MRELNKLFKSIHEAVGSVTPIEEEGEGIEYNTPFAFTDEYEEEEINMANTVDPFKESFKKIGRMISEISYKDFKSDPNSTMKQKLNNNIKEIYKAIGNAEKMINHASKLKTEIGADQTMFFKETFRRFGQIAERMNRLQTKLREFSK